MNETVENLLLDLLEWIGIRERPYEEVLEAWRTSCPRLPVWEEANDRGLVAVVRVDGRSIVRVTGPGQQFLRESRSRIL